MPPARRSDTNFKSYKDVLGLLKGCVKVEKNSACADRNMALFKAFAAEAYIAHSSQS